MKLELVKVELTREPEEECLATFWQQNSAGTTYARCHLPARVLPGQSLVLNHGDIREEGDSFEFPRQRGAAIWQFSGDRTRALLMAEMQEQGIRVLLEVDDNYTVEPPKFRGLNKQWVRYHKDTIDGHSIEAHTRIAEWVDGVICATPALAKQYCKLNTNVYTCPNGVDPSDWDSLSPEAGVDRPFRIVYAGSPSHQQDAPLVARALEWASRQSGVEVWAFGFRPDSWRFPVHVLPWQNELDDYRRALHDFDVGVAPLVETPWSVCKSDIKVLEYAMAGVFPIVSRTEPYRPWFEGPPLVASTAKDFYHHIKWAVANRDEVRRLAAETKARVLAERTTIALRPFWLEALEETHV